MAADYQIDTEGQHAFISFKVGHLGYSYIDGRFNDFTGEFKHDVKNPAASKVNLTIDTKSIDTNHAERDKHLRSAEFLDVGKFPSITFKSTGYQTGADGDTLKGDLTIHGVTKAVDIKVKHIGEGKDPWGGYRSGFRGNVMLDSKEFGMPDWVGDLEIDLNIEGVRM
jgi:polyisoprenoid-binding protein YceI